MAFDTPRAGEFFKAANHKDDYAFLIEVREIKPKSPGYKGELKDAVYADITCFKTEADLAEGAEPKVYRNARIDSALLYRELAENVGAGNETVRVLGQWKGDRNPKPSWVWRYTDEDARLKVIEWFERREAALEGAENEIPAYLR